VPAPAGKALVFLDASVWIAAAGSAQGGSALVLEVCRGQRFAALCSQWVLLEAQRNIRAKLSLEALARFYRLLAALVAEMTLVRATSEEEVAYEDLVGAKDAHVIAAAVKGSAAYVVTLDRRHLANERVNAAGLPCTVLTPGESLASVVRGANTRR